MAEKTITAANSVYMLSIIPIFAVPVRLQGFTADAAFETEDVEPAETPMGVDGHMSIGYVPTPTMQTISIMPDSPSDAIFDAWMQYNKAAREHTVANAVISLPGPQKAYICTRGVLSRITQINAVRKVMQGRTFRITWQSVDPTPYVGS